MTWNNVQPPCNTCMHCAQSSQYHGNHLGPTLPHTAYLHPQVTILCQLFSMLSTDIAIGRTADINEKAGVSLVSETDDLLLCVVLDQISLVRVCKVYRKYRKHWGKYLDHIMALNGGRHVCRDAPSRMGLYPQLGACQPGRKVPAGYMFLCSPHGDQ